MHRAGGPRSPATGAAAKSGAVTPKWVDLQLGAKRAGSVWRCARWDGVASRGATRSGARWAPLRSRAQAPFVATWLIDSLQQPMGPVFYIFVYGVIGLAADVADARDQQSRARVPVTRSTAHSRAHILRPYCLRDAGGGDTPGREVEALRFPVGWRRGAPFLNVRNTSNEGARCQWAADGGSCRVALDELGWRQMGNRIFLDDELVLGRE